jgi:hypothetical protein
MTEEQGTAVEPEQDVGVDTGEGKYDKLSAKYEKLQAEFEKRTNQMTARARTLEDKLESAQGRDQNNDQDAVRADELRDQYDDLYARLDDIEDAIDDAKADGDKEKVKKLRRESRRLSKNMDGLENDFKAIDANKQARKEEAKVGKNQEKWNNSWLKAMDKFPELASKDGTLNPKSELLQEAFSVLGEGAQKTKFAKFADRMNPDFDNSSGPYTAVLEAKMRLGNSAKSGGNDPRANEQMMSRGRGTQARASATSNVTQQSLDKMEAKAVQTGEKSDWAKLMGARAKFEGRRTE